MQQDLSWLILPTGAIIISLTILWRISLQRLKSYHSPLLGKVEVFKKYNGERMLSINSYLQGVSTEKKSIKQSYWYKIADLAVKHCHKLDQPKVLMLGLGANSISSLIGKIDPKIHQTIVEIDSSIIQACRDYFELDKLPNYTLIQADAYKLFDQKKALTQKFDVIVVDIYTGKPPFVSLKSNQPNFIEKLLPLLKKKGLILFNRPGHTAEAREDSQKLADFLKKFFQKTESLLVEDPRKIKNNVILGYQIKN